MNHFSAVQDNKQSLCAALRHFSSSLLKDYSFRVVEALYRVGFVGFPSLPWAPMWNFLVNLAENSLSLFLKQSTFHALFFHATSYHIFSPNQKQICGLSLLSRDVRLRFFKV